MAPGGSERIMGTLMDSKSNIRAGVSTEIKQHAYNSSIVEGDRGRYTQGVFWKWRSFCRRGGRSRKGRAETKGLHKALGETCLGEEETRSRGGAKQPDLNTKKAFG